MAKEKDAGPDPAVERMMDVASETELDPDQLVPTVRDFLVEQIKMRPKPWSSMSEDDQRDVFAAAEHAATELVRKAVETIVAGGRAEPIRALLTKFTHTDKITLAAEVKAYDEEETVAAVLGLHKARGKHVLIFVASVDDYRGDLGPEIEPDEPGLDFESGEPGDDDGGDE